MNKEYITSKFNVFNLSIEEFFDNYKMSPEERSILSELNESLESAYGGINYEEEYFREQKEIAENQNLGTSFMKNKLNYNSEEERVYESNIWNSISRGLAFF